jgi:tripartite ATP-independent transporter DctM subunit
VLTQRIFAGLDSFVILAVPLFILTGELMNECKITDKLIDACYALVGHVRGSLAQVNVLVSMIFAGISGSSQADTAGIGSVLIPAMIKKGYSKDFTVAVTCASSTMGVVIPPSITAVVYAASVNISVGTLFLGGIIPGILIAASQMAICHYYAVKYDYPREKSYPIKERIAIVSKAALPLLTPLIIIGGIIGGLFTATEAAAIAVVYSLLLAFIVYRNITLKQLWQILIRTGKMSSVALFCVGTSTIFSYIMAYYNVTDMLGSFITSISTSPVLFLMLIVGFFIVIGTFMDATPAIIVFAPIIAPIGESLGISPIQLGVIVIVTLALGLITPPYGLCLMLAAQIGEISIERAFKATFVFIVALLLVIMLLVLFPKLILFIPTKFAPNLM